MHRWERGQPCPRPMPKCSRRGQGCPRSHPIHWQRSASASDFANRTAATCFCTGKQVDFLEITADHFFDASIENQQELELLAAHFTLIPHGLNLSLGSAEGLDSAYLRKFARLVQRLKPPWWSEHIAFTRASGVEIGHLAPLPSSMPPTIPCSAAAVWMAPFTALPGRSCTRNARD